LSEILVLVIPAQNYNYKMNQKKIIEEDIKEDISNHPPMC